jgi:hypothetical protein
MRDGRCGNEADAFAYRVPEGCVGFMVLLAGLGPTLAVVTLDDFAAEIARTEREIVASVVARPEAGDPRASTDAFNLWRAARFRELRRAGADGDMEAVGEAVGRLMWAAMSYPGKADMLAAKVADAVAIYGHVALSLVEDGEGRVATVAGDCFLGLREMTQAMFAAVPLPPAGESACHSMIPDDGPMVSRRRTVH